MENGQGIGMRHGRSARRVAHAVRSTEATAQSWIARFRPFRRNGPKILFSLVFNPKYDFNVDKGAILAIGFGKKNYL